MPTSHRLDVLAGGRDREARLDGLREEARLRGNVGEAGMPIAGGPIPQSSTAQAAYYGQPIVKAPVWTWQIGAYFFVGGAAGMSGVIALAGLLTGESLAFVRAALGVAVAGALLSPALLIADLGRPLRFLAMLRVFKWRSAMSMGVWTLVTFSHIAMVALLLSVAQPFLTGAGLPGIAWRITLLLAVAGTALVGAVLATYTGVLLGATAVPVWAAHHRLLPFHFGLIALGSASAILELLGFRLAALQALGLGVAVVETGVGAWIELTRSEVEARALTHGIAGRLLRAAGICTGPAPLLFRLAGWVPAAAVCFLAGAVFSRYGWLLGGRASARDPQDTLRAQRGGGA